MWTSTIDLSPKRVILTNLLGRLWRGAYFSSFAPLRVQNAPRQPLPSTNWVRVRNRLAGICGSDLHLIYADGDLRVAPAALPNHTSSYLGHEVVGEVIEIGDDVQQLQVGDRVVLQHGPNCLSSGIQPLCRSCASGNYSLCERGTLPGPHPIGGGWSEEMLLHEQQLFRVPSAMSDTQAVLLEPSAVAVHAVLRHVPQAGDRVLIIGAGTIGLLTLQVVRALAPQAEISVQARYPFQVEKATRMGAAHIIYPQDSYAGVQQATQAQLYKGVLGNQMLLGGYDVIYDTIGNQRTIHDALRWARAKATIVLVGLNLHMMHVDLTPVWYQEINLIGTLGQGMETWPLGTNAQRSTFDITSDMITNSVLRPEGLITHHFALNNYRQALLTAIHKREQRAIKVVFDYSLLPASVVPNVRASARQRKQSPVDTRMLSPLATKDLTSKEPVSSLPQYSITPVPTPAPTHSSELPSRIVPAPAVDVSPTLEPAISNDLEQTTHEEPVGTDLSRPLAPATHDEEEQDSRETARVSPTPTTSSESEHAGETLAVSRPTHDEPTYDEPTEEQIEQSLVASLPDDSTAEPLQSTSTVPNEQEDNSLPLFDEEPLNELEWLDVMRVERDMPDDQNVQNSQDVQDIQYVPDIADTPPLPEDAWMEEEPVQYEDTPPKDFTLDSDVAGPDVEEEENATNAPIETFLSTKTTKAVNPGRQRSKNRHKGKHTTGSFRS